MGTRAPNAQGASIKHLDRLSDFDLLQRLRKRDLASLRELHSRHAGFVNAVAIRVLARSEEAAEVVQNVFLHLWTHGFELEEQRARFRSWLFVVSRNRAIDQRRLMSPGSREPARVSEEIRSLIGAAVVVSEGSGEAALPKAERVRFNEAIAALADPEREIVELAFYDGYTHTEIASELAAPLEDVKGRLRTAMETLHRILRANVDADEPSARVEPLPEEGTGADEERRNLESMAAAFALGALDGEERSAFETRLFSGDAVLWRRVRDFASTTDGLVSRVGSLNLPADAFSKLEERMTAEGMVRSSDDEDLDSGFSWMRLSLVLAALGGAAFLANAELSLRADLRELRADFTESEKGRAELGKDLAASKELVSETEFAKRQLEIGLAATEDSLASVMRPSGRDFRLRSSSSDLKVTSRGFVDAESNRIWVSIDALPALPPDQTYQLWVFVDDETVDGVVFAEEGAAGEGAIQIEATGPTSETGKMKIAVTIEPAGGSPLPTGPIILSGG